MIIKGGIYLNKFETILHPVRFKILQQFLDGQKKTAKTLAKQLNDIPQATLYRQLDTLVKADLLTVAQENQVRGTVEKVYALNHANAILKGKDIKNLTKEDHLQLFLLFTASLATDFESYLANDDFDFVKDGAGYRQVILHLSDEEFREFIKEMSQVVAKYSNNEPNPKRMKRKVSTIVIPDKERKNNHE